MNDLTQSFTKSLHTGYVDKSILSNPDYQPELLVNQKNPPKKVLSTIIHEFEHCNQFFISVAFVTTSGVAAIINKLKELEGKGIKGEMLVSQYLNFTQPEALKRLIQFKNIDLRIATTGNAHTKGYIFRNKEHYNLIVGSSNLTAQALCTNKEWNIKVSALEESGIVEKVLREFQSDFQKGTPVTFDYILSYEEIYQNQLIQTQKIKLENPNFSQPLIIPNSMQIEALENLQKIRVEGKNKALIISATGTGKTYLSAFDASAFNPKKLLFVVHRLTIAKDSLNTFKNVFGKNKTMGLFSGNQRDLDCDFVFSTIQTISKANHLDNFSKDHFDYIIIDETHRSGADSYLRLIEHFEPKFLLGMTATPERTDGDDIFQLFDHNIAYEIRLGKAMEEEMLSTFHYFGVADLTIDNIQVDKRSDFRYLVANERVERIIEQAKFYGSDNGITRGLIFCSRKKEAIELAVLFNLKGFKTVALTGDNSEEERAKAIEKLETDNLSEKLDYIFTVDIFNEGIDIPKINQIIMLRPTESSIIFIQQLGRGLRKVDGKGYLTVIDFIGNYENNYLIPIALYGDTSYNKDSLRKLITEGSRMIPGASTINFDEITKEQIFQSIDSANMQLYADLKKDYNLLKFKLGRIPMMMDFIEHGSRDPYLYVDYSNSYYNFFVKVEKSEISVLTAQEIKILELFAKEINNGKRIVECYILKLLIELESIDFEEIKTVISTNYNYKISKETYNSCINNLNFKFVRKEEEIIKIYNDKLIISKSFYKMMQNKTFKDFLIDNINYSIFSFNKQYKKELFKDGFILYQKYSRKDVCRILNWDLNEEATVYGYKLSNNSCPIFVNYHKEENIASSTKFPEKFLNSSQFLWYTKPQRRLSNSTIAAIKNHNNQLRLPLFMKKHNGEGTDFYFMGDVKPIDESFEETTIKNDQNNDVPVVKVILELATPVESTIYNYLTYKETDKEFPNNVSILNSNIEQYIINPIPLYDFYAAAGTFSEMQSEKDFILIEGPENYNPNNDYFACKIMGESMNRVIPNDSICLFKKYTGGSRNGKILLIEYRDIQDPDFNSAFTIKTYTSEKNIKEENWEHTSIILRPNSYDSSYQNIIITDENAQGMRVVGEFVQIMKECIK
jgi:superfamily II DNA or RNA helicase/HKD family nuclease/phage repressor protein C with HTH and peptisase S24 domain